MLAGYRIKNGCLRCGKDLAESESEYCGDCRKTDHHFDGGSGLYRHGGPVSAALYRFKYTNQRQYRQVFIRELLQYRGAELRRWQPDLIVPVPLSLRRRLNRGYNQSALLARELGRQTGIPVCTLLKRIRHTTPQRLLNRGERRCNLAGAFALRTTALREERRCFRQDACLLLIDDIYTTGSTMDALAAVLKHRGAARVYFLTISIGQGN